MKMKATNPKGPNTGSRRIYRGGSWDDGTDEFFERLTRPPEFFRSYMGFRVVCRGRKK